jgi:hypothetical protein
VRLIISPFLILILCFLEIISFSTLLEVLNKNILSLH